MCEQPYDRGKREYGGLRGDQAKRVKGLEQENARFKKLVVERALDNALVPEVGEGTFEARPAVAGRVFRGRASCTGRSTGRVACSSTVGRRTRMRRNAPRTKSVCAPGFSS